MSDNFRPNHSIAWLASEVEAALRRECRWNPQRRLPRHRSDRSLKCGVIRRSVAVGSGRIFSSFRKPRRRLRPLDSNFWGRSQKSFRSSKADTVPDKIDRARREIDYMRRMWGNQLDTDPYFNLNFSLQSSSFDLFFPPRRIKPWRSQALETKSYNLTSV